MKSIPERRDEYHITIATLLGCELGQPVDYQRWRYRLGNAGWSRTYPSAAEAARAWLVDNDHDLNGWQGREDETTS